MNERFVSIKVDREERPDLDQIYMDAVQLLTGRGGWPLTMFLTPDGKPFYGGTYFPPTDRHGLPAFPRVLMGISNAYHEKPEDVGQNVERLTQAISENSKFAAVEGEIKPNLAITAARNPRSITTASMVESAVHRNFPTPSCSRCYCECSTKRAIWASARWCGIRW